MIMFAWQACVPCIPSMRTRAPHARPQRPGWVPGGLALASRACARLEKLFFTEKFWAHLKRLAGVLRSTGSPGACHATTHRYLPRADVPRRAVCGLRAGHARADGAPQAVRAGPHRQRVQRHRGRRIGWVQRDARRSGHHRLPAPQDAGDHRRAPGRGPNPHQWRRGDGNLCRGQHRQRPNSPTGQAPGVPQGGPGAYEPRSPVRGRAQEHGRPTSTRVRHGRSRWKTSSVWPNLRA